MYVFVITVSGGQVWLLSSARTPLRYREWKKWCRWSRSKSRLPTTKWSGFSETCLRSVSDHDLTIMHHYVMWCTWHRIMWYVWCVYSTVCRMYMLWYGQYFCLIIFMCWLTADMKNISGCMVARLNQPEKCIHIIGTNSAVSSALLVLSTQACIQECICVLLISSFMQFEYISKRAELYTSAKVIQEQLQTIEKVKQNI